ncbi:hypothetical protein DRP07_05800 [Archaeoglobales archaeon]|nr:MAG: hypothetical protein DRP07_05800 [Archaeoglobales archaeon]
MVVSKAVFLALAALLFFPTIAEAYYDPPGPPAIEVRVYIDGILLQESMDDGYNGAADIKIDYKVIQRNQEVSKGSREVYYDWDVYKGGFMPLSRKILVYTQRECWPMKEVTLKLNLKETGVFLDKAIGENAVTLNHAGEAFVNVGKVNVSVEVEIVPIGAASEKCSWFYDQPNDYASSIVTHSGGYIYDWQLANMIKMWIVDKGYANMIFIFSQCFGGGMIDDLKDKLDGTGDAAFLSASKHDESAYGLGDSYNPDFSPELKKRGFTKPETYYPKEVSEELEKSEKPTIKEIARMTEKEDANGPYGIYKEDIEHPQYTSIGRGDDIRIGKKTDGSDVASKHAILFAGDANALRHWNNIDRMYKALRKQGFTDEDIIVLAGDGKKRSDGSDAPAYVDGPGTKKALYEAIQNVSKKMNKNEQFVFWVSDHGNNERYEATLNKAIKDPVREPIPPKKTAKNGKLTWDLNSDFLKAMARDPENEPYVSIIVEPPAQAEEISFFENVELYLNGEELSLELIEPIVAYDDNPDLDGYELVYPTDERLLKSDNLIEIGWGGSVEKFKEYEVLALQISTGGITEAVADLNESEISEEPTLYELLVEKKDEYNENVNAVPGMIKSIIGNERINIEIACEDGTLIVGAATENAYVTEFAKSGISDPTIRAWTTEKVVREVVESKDFVNAVMNAIKSGDIKYEGVGFVKSLKINIMRSLMGLYDTIIGMLG